MMLLRKVQLTSEPTTTVLPGCVHKYREIYPMLCEDMSDDELRAHIRRRVVNAASRHLLFENPLREGQIIAHTKESKSNAWYVLAENAKRGANYVIITVLVHEDRQFADELEAVEAACG